MPIVKNVMDNSAPSGAHLGVLTDESGAVLAIPVGASMFIITDPARFDGVMPIMLIKVSEKQLMFRCNCGNPKCTRVLKFQLKAEGFHPKQSHVAG